MRDLQAKVAVLRLCESALAAPSSEPVFREELLQLLFAFRDFDTGRGLASECRDLYRTSRVSQKNVNAYRMRHTSMPKQTSWAPPQVCTCEEYCSGHLLHTDPAWFSVKLQANTTGRHAQIIKGEQW